MQNIRIDRSDVNAELLGQELRTALSENFFGMSFSDQYVVLHFNDEVTSEMVAQGRQIVIDHDATALTDAQQRAQERRTKLEQARADREETLSLDDFNLEGPLLRRLARKLRWLELEIRELRDL